MEWIRVSASAADDVRFASKTCGKEGSGHRRGVHSKATKRQRPRKPRTRGKMTRKLLQAYSVPPHVSASSTAVMVAMKMALPEKSMRTKRRAIVWSL